MARGKKQNKQESWDAGEEPKGKKKEKAPAPLAERDPMYAREAQKYERPIVSRELILDYLAKLGAPAKLERIAEDLEVEEEDVESLCRRLKAMERDGQVVRNRKNAYGVAERMDLIRGRVSGHPDGFGFLIPDEGGNDLFLSPKQMRLTMHGDIVLGRVVGVDRRGRPEGAVVRVLERANQRLVGRFFMEDDVSIVVPEDKRITQDFLVPPKYRGDALHGQIVTIEITQQPDGRLQPVGKVVEVLGDHMGPGMEVEIAIRKYDLPHVWAPEAVAEAEAFPDAVPEEAKAGRVDLRELPLVTIDGEDARDFDDAVFAERQGNGFRLIVAIADVGAYVQEGSHLDRAAYERGNSVYFPNRVIPMLPETLSNGLCSLNPQVDRLALACEMFVSATGQIKRFRFFEAVIRSHQRFTYTTVAAILQHRDPVARDKHVALLEPLETLYALYHALLHAREKRGAIDFDTQETRIIYGEDMRIERIVPTQRNDAHRMIEECMLAANVCAASFFQTQEIPVLYRVHHAPPPDRLEDLKNFLAELGIPFRVQGEVTAKHYAKLLDKVRGRKDFNMVQTIILRSMSQAIYSPDNAGHFGLAYPAYTHFTSPIRRYPDLLVHRTIKQLLNGVGEGWFGASHGRLQEMGAHCSATERRADEATRDAVNWLKCEYMLDKVGQVFSGIVTGVTGFGLFVQLDEVFVEGLVHISTLGNDYFHFQAERYRLIGERTGRRFQLGVALQVRVVQVNLDDGKIDFELAEAVA